MKTTLTTLLALPVLAGTANAAILSTDFDSLSTGAVTAANLNSVTTGGTWSLSADTNLTHSIVDDGGDKAFLSDHANDVGAGLLVTATLTLDSAIDTSALTSDLLISFDTHPEAATSFQRKVNWRFLDASDNLLFEAFADDNGKLKFKAGPGGHTELGTEGEWQGNANFTWDADHARVAQFEFTVTNTGSVTFDENTNGWTATDTLGAVTDDIAKIQFLIDPGSPYGQGIFLNDITIVPEPGSLALLGLGGLLIGSRRRRGN